MFSNPRVHLHQDSEWYGTARYGTVRFACISTSCLLFRHSCTYCTVYTDTCKTYDTKIVFLKMNTRVQNSRRHHKLILY